ncbi:MAG: polyphosphate polymerase domain-containing protein [Lachnospiraceae bacterium]|nr:polyphosphate polymerase domain-containing protein [Lachnospiraceae bacterium]
MEKYRNEIKYICSEQELRQIGERIRHICKTDAHAGPENAYLVRSVYFDDERNSCYFENENGTQPREKFRIRIYNNSLERITLECKRKEHGMNRKNSCPLTRDMCRALVDGDFSVTMAEIGERKLNAAQKTLLTDFLVKYRMGHFSARVIVAYERTPYIYPVGNVRITFDRNIVSSGNAKEFMRPEICTRPVMPAGRHVLEVKYDELLPDYIYQALQNLNLQRTAYSKYYICRKYTI